MNQSSDTDKPIFSQWLRGLFFITFMSSCSSLVHAQAANPDSLATRRAGVWQHALNLSPEQTRQLVQLEKKWMVIMQDHKTKQRENPKESKSPFDNNRSTLDADFRAILTTAQAQRYDSIRHARLAALQASGKYPTSKQ